MSQTPPPKLEFDSPEEFAALMRAISRRLHHVNRVAAGEKRFVWQVADLVQRLGVTFRDHYEDRSVQAAFGDGWTPGDLPREAQAEALFDLTQGRGLTDGPARR